MELSDLVQEIWEKIDLLHNSNREKNARLILLKASNELDDLFDENLVRYE